MFVSFSNGHGSTFENSWIADILLQASLRDVERQRCWKRGSGDFGTALRHDLAIFSSMPLTGEVRRSPEPSARPSAAADSEERQICTTCLFTESAYGWIVLMLSPIVRDVQRQRCSKRGSGDGQRLSLYDYGTTERSFHAVERWGSTLTCTVCTAADSEERQIVRRAYSRRALDCEKDDGLTCMYAFSCMLSPIVIVEHTSVWEVKGVGGRGEIWRGIPQSNTKDQLPKPQTATVATAQRLK